MKDILVWVLVVGFVGILLFMLGVIIRFSFISPMKTKGAKNRLRKPDVRGIEALCGFSPSPELIAFYKESPLVEKSEITLIDKSCTPTKEWFIMGFKPCTLVDVREWRKITGVSGIPLSTDGEKGMYFVDRNGTVKLQSPNVENREVLVASSINVFASFEVKAESDEDEDD